MAHVQKPDLVFQRNKQVRLNWRGCQFSGLLAAEECGSADSNCIDRVPTYSGRLLATHSIRIFPLHFPSRASPCAIRFWTRYNKIIVASSRLFILLCLTNHWSTFKWRITFVYHNLWCIRWMEQHRWVYHHGRVFVWRVMWRADVFLMLWTV